MDLPHCLRRAIGPSIPSVGKGSTDGTQSRNLMSFGIRAVTIPVTDHRLNGRDRRCR
jgi:hypothetical protein